MQQQSTGVSRTFVLIDPALSFKQVLGFFSLAACQASGDDLPVSLKKKFPRSVPAILLGRLAIDVRSQGQGFGRALMVEATRRVATASEFIGLVGLFVDAKDEPASRFYQRFGFVPLPNDSHRLFLPLETLHEVAKLLRAGSVVPRTP